MRMPPRQKRRQI